MYIPSTLVQIAHDEKLKQMGVMTDDRKPENIADWQHRSWAGRYYNNQKRIGIIRRIFSWIRWIDLYRKCKAAVRQLIRRGHAVEESCVTPILTTASGTFDCSDRQEEHGFC